MLQYKSSKQENKFLKRKGVCIMANSTIKVTRVDALNKAIEVLGSVEGNAEYIEVLDKIKASVSKKSVSKADEARMAENETIRTAIVDFLTDRKARVSDITKGVNDILGTDFTSNKVSAQVTVLKNEGTVVREVDKKIAFFSLA